MRVVRPNVAKCCGSAAGSAAAVVSAVGIRRYSGEQRARHSTTSQERKADGWRERSSGVVEAQ